MQQEHYYFIDTQGYSSYALAAKKKVLFKSNSLPSPIISLFLRAPRKVLPQIARAALLDGASVYNPEDTDYKDNPMVLEAAWEEKPLNRNKLK